MCQFSIYKEGSRSYGDNLPGYAQGAYLPGDEPGYYCKKSGCRCYLDGWASHPDYCYVQEYTDKRCNDCNKILMRNGDNVLYCPSCGCVQ